MPLFVLLGTGHKADLQWLLFEFRIFMLTGKLMINIKSVHRESTIVVLRNTANLNSKL